MTVAEIEHGMATAKWGDQKRNRMRSHLAAFLVYESCPELCRSWGEVMAESAATGRRMSHEDAWIAATAVLLSAPLATNNRKHFAHLTRLAFFLL
jgi:predicted nucleic acid-binding protein